MPWVTKTASAAAPATHGTTCVVILARFSRVGGMQFPNHDCSRSCQGAQYLRKSRWISYPLFHGNNAEALERARAGWKRFKAEGHEVTYWQQDENGRWQNRAA